MTDNIIDFTDYAKPFCFKYEKVNYQIPALNKEQQERLMEINKRVINTTLDDEDIENDETLSKKEKTLKLNELGIDKTRAYFNMTEEYIQAVVFKQQPDNSLIAITLEDVRAWPLRVKQHVMKAINSQMNIAAEDDETEKKS